MRDKIKKCVTSFMNDPLPALWIIADEADEVGLRSEDPLSRRLAFSRCFSRSSRNLLSCRKKIKKFRMVFQEAAQIMRNTFWPFF